MLSEKSIFQQYIESVPDPMRDLVRETREAVLYALPEVKETLKWGNLTFEYPPSTKLAALVTHKQHINLQLFTGSGLNDPQGRLEGAGVNMRHVKIRGSDDIDREYFATLLRQAADK